jgi:hypothetical protein
VRRVLRVLRVRDGSGKPGAVFGEDLKRMARRRVFEPERPHLDELDVTSHTFATTSPASLKCVFLAFLILQLTTPASRDFAFGSACTRGTRRPEPVEGWPMSRLRCSETDELRSNRLVSG